jgi:hypothetical protein
MNRLSKLILFNILLQTFLSAQKYYPFETTNVVWNELKESGYLKVSGYDYPPNKFIETYFINGDTIINDFKFYKIFIQGSNDSSYIGCFREEDRKVYYNGVDYFHFETDSIILLYDFNKQKNDTIYTGTWHRSVINEIDSILIGNSYRKRFQMDDGQFWIEGIGSNFGFLYPMTEIPTMYWRSELICYKHNDSLLYLSPNYIDCNTEKQPSTQFAPIGAKWYYSNRENPLGGPEEGYLLIESTGDTIIDYITVRKLKKTYFSSDGNKEELGFEFVYAIENKVYYLNEANSYLLYDFNAETGDTLTFREPYFTGFSSDSTFSLIVDSTNHLIINGINLKTIYLHNLSNILGRWDLYNVHIEKIGNTTYMFPQSILDCDAACFDPLRCYINKVLEQVYEILSRDSLFKVISKPDELPIKFTVKSTTFLMVPELEGIEKKCIAVYCKNPITEKFQRLIFDFNIKLSGHPVNDIAIFEAKAIEFLNEFMFKIPLSVINK